jgi:hypothetical protein
LRRVVEEAGDAAGERNAEFEVEGYVSREGEGRDVDGGY